MGIISLLELISSFFSFSDMEWLTGRTNKDDSNDNGIDYINTCVTKNVLNTLSRCSNCAISHVFRRFPSFIRRSWLIPFAVNSVPQIKPAVYSLNTLRLSKFSFQPSTFLQKMKKSINKITWRWTSVKILNYLKLD